ncbi:MAG: ATP-binding protein [Sandaracinaceae bacterium]|nr:ATP-binding protein [Sandaracinaceae bacterium]
MPRSGGWGSAALVFAAFLVVSVFVIAWLPWRERSNARAALEHKAENQARLIAYTIAPAIEFGDAEAAREAFRGAARDGDFVGVVAHDADGVEVAREGRTARDPSSIVVVVPVETAAGRVGTLRLTTSTQRITRQSREQLMASAAIAVMILLLGGAVGLWVRRSIQRISALTDENARALAAAEQARIKSRFLANTSHEIRTPLNGVLGLADVLSRRPLDRATGELVSAILRSARNLLSLVNDVLDLSRLESGQVELESAPFDPERSALTVCETLASTYRERGVELVLDVAWDVPASVAGDRLRVEQVITNLVGNAVKFTQRGRVVVTMCWAEDELRVAVRDTGIGVPADKLENIFEAFSQAEASTTRRFGGSGLGLAITKELVHKMGGELTVESTVGEGSTFSFHGHAPLVTPADELGELELPRRVLVAAADPEAGSVLVRHAERAGANAELVEPPILQARLDELAEDGVVVLWDARLDPPSEGLHRALARPSVRVLVHATVVDDASIDGVQTAVLPKPFSRAAFARALDGSSARAGDAAEEGTSVRVDAGLRLLVAEDDETNRLVVQSFMSELGVRADMAMNGSEAVQMATSGRPYDIVLMDCQMPELDGYEAARRIRAWEKQRSLPATPIVAVTAHAVEEERQLAREAGMDGFVTKPLTLESFLGAVRQLLPAAIAPRGAERPARVAGDSDEIARAFQRGADEGLAAIAAAMRGEDLEAILRHAHRIRGACLMVGASKAASLAATLEDHARSRDVARIGEVALSLELELVEAAARLSAAEP